MKIPQSELDFSYARSSGPGGQNVNKVNSKVILRWNLLQSAVVSEAVRNRFLESFGSRVTEAGDVVLMSDRYRDQLKNREDCVSKLEGMLASVWHPPKKRKKSKPTRSSVIQRRESKKRQSDKKAARKRVF